MLKSRQINWGPAIFLILYQVLLLVSLPFYFYYYTPQLGTVIVSIALLYITGLSITAGYHRYFAHRSYRAKPIVEYLLLFFGTMTIQGSILRWSFDHRMHHAHVDTDQDPYSIKKGFWYAHFLWILDKPKTINPKIVSGLLKNKAIAFQHRYYELLMILVNLLVFLSVGWLFDDYMGALFLACGLRIFALHHFTWFINSLAHTWGNKPFCQEQSAVDNYIISLLTFGEGYHNYHHTFANDYRNGVRWYHYDPTKWLIWLLSKCKLTYALRKIDLYTINKRMVIERKNLLLDKLKEICHAKKEELERSINQMSEQIVQKIALFNQLKQNYYYTKKESKLERLQELKQELKNLKKSIRQDWRLWLELSRHILNPQSIAS
jgi:stearoyl-CoA desaturase (delta-9 desaturase)